MKKIRIGNTISFEWTVMQEDGQPYNMQSLSPKVYVCRQPSSVCQKCGEAEVCTALAPVTIGGTSHNVLTFTWQGNAQDDLGRYNLKLVTKEDQSGQVVFDEKEVFELMPHSWQAEGGEDGPVAVISLSLTSQMENEIFQRLEDIEADDWVTTARIADDAVTTDKIAANAVTRAKLATALQAVIECGYQLVEPCIIGPNSTAPSIPEGGRGFVFATQPGTYTHIDTGMQGGTQVTQEDGIVLFYKYNAGGMVLSQWHKVVLGGNIPHWLNE